MKFIKQAGCILAAGLVAASSAGCSTDSKQADNASSNEPITQEVSQQSLDDAREQLKAIQVRDDDVAAEREAQKGYKAEKFGYPDTATQDYGWPAGFEACNVRWATLYNDADNPSWDDQSSCMLGADVKWTDPYGKLDDSGNVTYKESDDPKDFDIDHIAARKDMWISGANKMSEDELHHMGNDPLNLVAVDLSVNRSKGDQSPEDFMPVGKYRCDYAQHYIGVKNKYHLSTTQGDVDRLNQTIDECSSKVEK